MNKIKIFLAAPISGIEDETQYKKSRESIIDMINYLNTRYQVYSEILNIGSLAAYEEPGQSAKKDLKKISESDVFIIYHPMKMQTSTLIELGYAVAMKKKIIMIAEQSSLPYLALGLEKYSSDIKCIPSSELKETVYRKVEMAINKFFDEMDI